MCHTRAGAWIELSCLDEGDEPFGLVDHAGPLLGQVAEPSSCVSNSVIDVSLMPGPLPGQVSEEKSIIFSTYCLDERRKWNGDHDGDSGAKDLDKEEAERFVQTLIEFAGDDEGFSMGKQQKPRTFQFDISEVVKDLDLDLNSSADEIWQRAEEEKKQALGAKASKGKKSQDKNAKKREKLANCKRFWPVYDPSRPLFSVTCTCAGVCMCVRTHTGTHTRTRTRTRTRTHIQTHLHRFLPAKDITHLVCFESKACEMKFREQLSARTPVGNFIIEGDAKAAQLFNRSIKKGTPVFVMKGSGGAADKLSLVLT